MNLSKTLVLLALSLGSSVAMAQKAGNVLNVSKYKEYKDINTPYIYKNLADGYYMFYDGSSHEVSTTNVFVVDGKVALRTASSPNLGKSDVETDGGLAACKAELDKSAKALSTQYKYSFRQQLPITSYNDKFKNKVGDYYFFSDSPLTFKDLKSDGNNYSANVPFAQVSCVLSVNNAQIRFFESVPSYPKEQVSKIVKTESSINRKAKGLVDNWRGYKLNVPVSSYGDNVENSFLFYKNDNNNVVWSTSKNSDKEKLNLIASKRTGGDADGDVVGVQYEASGLNKDQCVKMALTSVGNMSKLIGGSPELLDFDSNGVFVARFSMEHKINHNYLNVECVNIPNGVVFKEILMSSNF